VVVHPARSKRTKKVISVFIPNYKNGTGINARKNFRRAVMDLGIGIAGIAISAGAVAITAIKVRANGNGNGNGKPCPLHSGIEATLDFLKDGVDRIEDKLDRLIGGDKMGR